MHVKIMPIKYLHPGREVAIMMHANGISLIRDITHIVKFSSDYKTKICWKFRKDQTN